jgi:hypothetical protein
VNKATKDALWADYAAGKGIATNREETAEIMSQWLEANPWFKDRGYYSDRNLELIAKEMGERGYEFSLVSLTAAVNALFAQGKMQKSAAPVKEEVPPEPDRYDSDRGAWVSENPRVEPVTPELQAFADEYEKTPAGAVKIKMCKKEYREMLDRVIAAGLIKGTGFYF